MIKKILKHIPKNASWFDIIEISGSSTPLSFKNNRFHSIQEKHNSGYGIRINISGKTGFSHCNSPEKIKETVEKATLLASYGDMENFKIPDQTTSDFDPYDKAIDKFDVKFETVRAEAVIERITKTFPEANLDLGINSTTGNCRIINSNGIDASYKNSYYSASVSATLIQNDGTKIDTWESISGLASVSFDNIADRIIEKIRLAEKLEKKESGRIPVILSPRAFSRLIGIIASGLNSKSVYKGISPFSDKLNETFFNQKFSLTDDPRVSGSPYSSPFDDEGVNTAEKKLIHRGQINDFIADLNYAQKLNLKKSGNASRGYSSLPGPSFSNIIIANGVINSAEMIKNIDSGIFIDGFIGLGQSNTLSGDFSAGLDLAFLIKNGEITGRLKDCMISDNLFQLMKDEIHLSSDRELTGSTLAPYILFPSVNYTG